MKVHTQYIQHVTWIGRYTIQYDTCMMGTIYAKLPFIL